MEPNDKNAAFSFKILFLLLLFFFKKAVKSNVKNRVSFNKYRKIIWNSFWVDGSHDLKAIEKIADHK